MDYRRGRRDKKKGEVHHHHFNGKQATRLRNQREIAANEECRYCFTGQDLTWRVANVESFRLRVESLLHSYKRYIVNMPVTDDEPRGCEREVGTYGDVAEQIFSRATISPLPPLASHSYARGLQLGYTDATPRRFAIRHRF